MRSAYSILGDNPVSADRDRLNFKQFVEPFAARLVQSAANTPFTVGIFAEWGQGKSTTMQMLAAALNARGCPTVWFDPWRYNTRETVWKGLVLTLIASIRRNDSLMREFRRKKKGLKRLTATYLWSRLLGREWAEELVTAVEQEPWSPALLHEFERQIDELLAEVRPTQDRSTPFVLFVDDLDRCLPEAALAVLEALKLVLSKPGVITIMGIAEWELSRAVGAAYAREMKDAGWELDPEWGRKYMRKMIQMPFPLPTISPGSFEQYVGECLRESHLASALGDPERWQPLIREASQSNLREVKRFINHFIAEIDKAAANAPQAAGPSALDERRVAFVHLLAWRFGEFFEYLRRQVTDRDLLLRYTLFFVQRAQGITPDASLLEGQDDRYSQDPELALVFTRCFGSSPPLVAPFSAGQEVEPYLQFGLHSTPAGVTSAHLKPSAPADTTAPPAPEPPPSAAPPSRVAAPPAAGSKPSQTPAAPAEEIQALASRIRAMLASSAFEEAEGMMAQAFDAASRLGDRNGEGVLWALRGEMSEARGHHAEAVRAFERALAISRDLRLPRSEGALLLNIAQVELWHGDKLRARELSHEAATLAERTKDSVGEMNARTLLAEAHESNDEAEEARRQYRKALAIAERLGHKAGELLLLERLERLMTRIGRDNIEVLSRAEALASELGDRKALVRILSDASLRHARLGNMAAALEALEKAHGAASDDDDRALLARTESAVSPAV